TEWLRHRHGFGCDRHRWLPGHQLDEIVEVEVVLVHAREAAEHALARVLHLHRRLGVCGQATQRHPAGDRLQGDVQIRYRRDNRAEVAQHATWQVPADEVR